MITLTDAESIQVADLLDGIKNNALDDAAGAIAKAGCAAIWEVLRTAQSRPKEYDRLNDATETTKPGSPQPKVYECVSCHRQVSLWDDDDATHIGWVSNEDGKWMCFKCGRQAT